MHVHQKFWLHEPSALWASLNLIPQSNSCIEEQLNAMTRLVILLGIAGLVFGIRHAEWYWLGAVLLIMVYYTHQPLHEPFQRNCEINAAYYPAARCGYVAGDDVPIKPPSHDSHHWSRKGYTRSDINTNRAMSLQTSGMFPGGAIDTEASRFKACLKGVDMDLPEILTNTAMIDQCRCPQMSNLGITTSEDCFSLPNPKPNAAAHGISAGPMIPEYLRHEGVFDPRTNGHGQSSRAYLEPVTGQIRYGYEDIDFARHGRPDVGGLPWHGGDAAYIDLTNSHRQNMQSTFMKKGNEIALQRRNAPIRQLG